MSLLTLPYFRGTNPDCVLLEGQYNTIQAHIDRYERDILIQLLGYVLAKLTIAYSDASEQRIKDLVEGKEYQVNGHTVKWNGLLNDERVSLLAYYILIQSVTNRAIAFENVGTVSDQVVSPAGFIIDKGLRLRELAGYPRQDPYAPSLYNFLYNHQSIYPEWVFNEYRAANIFSI